MKPYYSLSSQYFILFVTSIATKVEAAAIAKISDRCTNIQVPVLNCTNSDPAVFVVTYPDTELECAMPMTIEQSGKEPTLGLVGESAANTDENDFYTILLVDTADTFFHPILHYGASNIRGDKLNVQGEQMVLADASPFSGYRGPSPPAGVPGTESILANYEWIVAKQEAFINPEDLPFVGSNIGFNYNEYLTNVNATVLATMYFSSGFCVDGIEINPTVAPTTNGSWQSRNYLSIQQRSFLSLAVIWISITMSIL